MNQNRNNNRRRGRNNRGGQGGGGSQGNRIDSRARGNAPQMLEKYKKMAHDASLNGDRVQTEYYLQFADHYFRVIADQKSPRDDQQQQRARNNDRDRDDDNGDYEDDDRQPQRDSRNDRDDRDDRDDREERDFGGQRGSEGEPDAPVDDVRDNPFVRESKPRRPRARKNGAESEASGLDPATLPPAIGNDDDGAEETKRPRRTRSRRVSEDEEAREAHG